MNEFFKSSETLRPTLEELLSGPRLRRLDAVQVDFSHWMKANDMSNQHKVAMHVSICHTLKLTSRERRSLSRGVGRRVQKETWVN